MARRPARTPAKAKVASDVRLNVKYTGDVPDRGRMGASEIGPAIIGMGEMVAEASRVLFGDETRVRLEVQADFQHASFGIEFVLTSGLPGQIWDILTSDKLANLAQVLGFVLVPGGTIGLLQYLKWQKGKKVTAEPDGDNIRISQVGTGNTTIVNKIQYNIFMNPRIRRGAEQVVAPLEQEGVDGVEIREEEKEPVRIDRKDRDDITNAPMPEAEVSVTTGKAYLEVVSPVFREGNKWRFAQGESLFHAKIEDERFLAEVEKHRQTFGQGDVLYVDLEVTSKIGPKGPDADRVITKVHKHIQSTGTGAQLPMDLLPPGEDA